MKKNIHTRFLFFIYIQTTDTMRKKPTMIHLKVKLKKNNHWYIFVGYNNKKGPCSNFSHFNVRAQL